MYYVLVPSLSLATIFIVASSLTRSLCYLLHQKLLLFRAESKSAHFDITQKIALLIFNGVYPPRTENQLCALNCEFKFRTHLKWN